MWLLIPTTVCLASGCSTTTQPPPRAVSPPSQPPGAESGWERLELGPRGEQGLRKVKENISGFEIRYALGLRDLAPVDIEVYDTAGNFILKINRLEQRPRECRWADDRSGVIIDGRTYRRPTIRIGLPERPLESSPGKLPTESFDIRARFTGSSFVSDPGSGRHIKVQSGMSKQQIESLAKSAGVRFKRETDDKWSCGNTVLHFRDGKLGEIEWTGGRLIQGPQR